MARTSELSPREREQLEETFEAHLRDGVSIITILQCLGSACDNLATISKESLKKPEEVQRAVHWGQCRDMVEELSREVPAQ